MAEQRDIVVVGASAGGIDALARVVPTLPADLPATVFVVVHIPAEADSHLPEILSRWGPMTATHAVDGEPLRRGRILVAPPDRHLLVDLAHARVVLGPRENCHRPAINPLFRSAASSHGRRVIGVVLSGSRDDGATGLASVKQAGGMCVVQSPEDAIIPNMPQSALKATAADHVLPASEIGKLIARLVQEPLGRAPVVEAQEPVPEPVLTLERAGSLSGNFSCPECGGVLQERPDGASVVYICRVGHTYSEQALMASQSNTLESALWVALRALEEREDMARRIADRARKDRRDLTVELFERRAQEASARAGLIRAALLAGDGGNGQGGQDA